MSSERPFGNYRLIQRLGVGGMGETWHAVRDGPHQVSKDVVIKRILRGIAGDPVAIEAFISEARLSTRLSHGNIAQVFEFGEIDGEYFMAMEYVLGQSLESLLERARKRNLAGLPSPLALYIACELLKGLHHAHECKGPDGQPLQIVHRDVSPDNVIISYEGEIKLVDFGIAKAELQGRAKTEPGTVKGKYLYFSPEQARARPVDARSDVFSAAVVLYAMLAGRLPTEGQAHVVLQRRAEGEHVPLKVAAPWVGDSLASVVERGLARNPADRFASALEFQQALGVELLRFTPAPTQLTVSGSMCFFFGEELSSLGRTVVVPRPVRELMQRHAESASSSGPPTAVQRAPVTPMTRPGSPQRATEQAVPSPRGSARWLVGGGLALTAALVSLWLLRPPASAPSPVRVAVPVVTPSPARPMAMRWIEGNVIDDEARPVIGAEFRGPPSSALACSKWFPGSFQRCACDATVKELFNAAIEPGQMFGTSGPGGAFSIQVPADLMLLEVVTPDHRGYAKLILERPAQPFELRLSPQASFSFEVESNWPQRRLPPAGVVAGALGESYGFYPARRVNGHYEVGPLPAVRPRIIATADGMGISGWSGSPGTHGRVTLRPAQQIEGRVDDDGAGASGAEVTIDPDGCAVKTTTDERGLFHAAVSSADRQDVLLARKGSQGAEVKLTPIAGREWDTWPLRLATLAPNAGPLTLALEGPEGTRAQRVGWLEVKAHDGSYHRYNFATDADGKAVLPVVAQGTAKLTVWYFDVPESLQHFELSAPRSTPLQVKLSPARSLYVSTRDVEGHALTGGRVTFDLDAEQERTIPDDVKQMLKLGIFSPDSTGLARVMYVPPGHYRVHLDHDALGSAVNEEDFPGELTLKLTDAFELDLSVTLKGQPAPGTRVHATQGKVFRSCTTDSAGRCRFAFPVAGKVALELIALAELEIDQQPQPGTAARNTTAKVMVSAEVPERTELTVALTPVPAIEGTVIDARGQPIAGAMVVGEHLVSHDGDEPNFDEHARETRSDDAGHFSFHSEQSMSVFAKAIGMTSSNTQLVKPGRSVKLRLEPAGFVTGQVVDKGGVPLPRFGVGGEIFASPDGRFDVTYEDPLVVHGDDIYPTTIDVKPKPGSTVDAGKVEIAMGVMLNGKVIDDATELPIAGADVLASQEPVFALLGEAGLKAFTRTDADGRFVTEAMAPASLRVHFFVSARGYLPLERDFTFVDDRAFRLKRRPAATGP